MKMNDGDYILIGIGILVLLIISIIFICTNYYSGLSDAKVCFETCNQMVTGEYKTQCVASCAAMGNCSKITKVTK